MTKSHMLVADGSKMEENAWTMLYGAVSIMARVLPPTSVSVQQVGQAMIAVFLCAFKSASITEIAHCQTYALARRVGQESIARFQCAYRAVIMENVLHLMSANVIIGKVNGETDKLEVVLLFIASQTATLK